MGMGQNPLRLPAWRLVPGLIADDIPLDTDPSVTEPVSYIRPSEAHSWAGTPILAPPANSTTTLPIAFLPENIGVWVDFNDPAGFTAPPEDLAAGGAIMLWQATRNRPVRRVQSIMINIFDPNTPQMLGIHAGVQTFASRLLNLHVNAMAFPLLIGLANQFLVPPLPAEDYFLENEETLPTYVPALTPVVSADTWIGGDCLVLFDSIVSDTGNSDYSYQISRDGGVTFEVDFRQKRYDGHSDLLLAARPRFDRYRVVVLQYSELHPMAPPAEANPAFLAAAKDFCQDAADGVAPDVEVIFIDVGSGGFGEQDPGAYQAAVEAAIEDFFGL